VLLLSAAGLYALMAFTVAQRRREIGIRSALGAQPGHLVAAVFRRVFWQIGAGSAAGILAAYVAGRYVPIEQVGGLPIPGILPGAAAFMLLVGVADDCFDSGDDLAGRVAWEQSVSASTISAEVFSLPASSGRPGCDQLSKDLTGEFLVPSITGRYSLFRVDADDAEEQDDRDDDARPFHQVSPSFAATTRRRDRWLTFEPAFPNFQLFRRPQLVVHRPCGASVARPV
jgi:hypothetical protein